MLKKQLTLLNNGTEKIIFCGLKYLLNRNNIPKLTAGFNSTKNFFNTSCAQLNDLSLKPGQKEICSGERYQFFGPETAQFRQVLKKYEKYRNSLALSTIMKYDDVTDDIFALSGMDLKNFTNEDLLKIFVNVSYKANETQANLGNGDYDNVLQELKTRIKTLTDSQLRQLLKCFEFWYIDKHYLPYKELWTTIDEECIERMRESTQEISHDYIDNILYMIDQMFKLRLLHVTSYPYYGLQRIGRRIKYLKPHQLVHLAFFMKYYTRIPVNLYEMEYYIEKYIDEFTIEELGVIALGFFYQETKIKSNDLMHRIIKMLVDNIDNVDDITLAAVSKILRYSFDPKIVSSFTKLLEKLITQIPKRNLSTLVHLAHMQARILIENPETMILIIKRYEAELKNARLKDIERILFALFVFKYTPEKCSLYSLAKKELQGVHRQDEISKFPKSFVYSILYMLEANYFSTDLLKKILNPQYVDDFCQGNIYKLDRTYLVIDQSIEIEHPNYDGPRLRRDIVELLIKRFGALNKYHVSHNAKAYQWNKLMTDLVQTCKTLLGAEDLIYIANPLPHFAYSYLIICLDKFNRAISPIETLSNLPKTKIHYAPQDGNKWFAFIIGTHNTMTRDKYQCAGILEMQRRQLKRLGYIPKIVPYKTWQALDSQEQKKQFIEKNLYSQ